MTHHSGIHPTFLFFSPSYPRGRAMGAPGGGKKESHKPRENPLLPNTARRHVSIRDKNQESRNPIFILPLACPNQIQTVLLLRYLQRPSPITYVPQQTKRGPPPTPASGLSVFDLDQQMPNQRRKTKTVKKQTDRKPSGYFEQRHHIE